MCEKCNNVCNSIYFQCNFKNWTSGNNDIDKFIQSTQLSAHKEVSNALEWISYNRLYDIKYVTKSDSDEMYIANWIDGHIKQFKYQNSWDNNNQNWKRENPNMPVVLKILNNSVSII
jgi:hypothetical protein